MAEAAILGTQIEHSSALGGLLAGLVVGATVVGALAATVATGGVAGALFVGAAACGGASMGGMIGERFGSFATTEEGPITGGCVATVLYEGKPAAHATSLVICTKDGPGAIAQGSSTVFVGGFMASRKGDKTTCGAKIGSGCKSVDIGGPTATQPGMTIDEEVPEWMHTALTVLGAVGAIGTIIFAPAAVGITMMGMAARVGCGFVLGTGGHYLGEWGGGKIFGEGSFGQAVTITIGELGGGWLGGKLGGKLVPGEIDYTFGKSSGGVNSNNIIAEDGYRIGSENIKAGSKNIEDANFSKENIQKVQDHLSRDQFLEGNEMSANNKVMIDRLKAIENGELEPSIKDKAFITHEVRESELMESGMDYDTAHAQACKEYGIDVKAESQNPFYTDKAIDLWNKQIMKNLGF